MGIIRRVSTMSFLCCPTFKKMWDNIKREALWITKNRHYASKCKCSRKRREKTLKEVKINSFIPANSTPPYLSRTSSLNDTTQIIVYTNVWWRSIFVNFLDKYYKNFHKVEDPEICENNSLIIQKKQSDKATISL